MFEKYTIFVNVIVRVKEKKNYGGHTRYKRKNKCMSLLKPNAR